MTPENWSFTMHMDPDTGACFWIDEAGNTYASWRDEFSAGAA